MNVDTSQALLLVLSAGFLVLLILACILVFLLISIIRRIHHIVRIAEATTENMGDSLRVVGKKMAPFVVSGLVGMAARTAKKKRRGNG